MRSKIGYLACLIALGLIKADKLRTPTIGIFSETILVTHHDAEPVWDALPEFKVRVMIDRIDDWDSYIVVVMCNGKRLAEWGYNAGSAPVSEDKIFEEGVNPGQVDFPVPHAETYKITAILWYKTPCNDDFIEEMRAERIFVHNEGSEPEMMLSIEAFDKISIFDIEE